MIRMMRMRLGHEPTTQTRFKTNSIDVWPILGPELYWPPSPPGLGKANRFRASDFFVPHLGVEVLVRRQQQLL